ncbi:MAG: ACT domain-containing protein [Clostridia bacterium]|nr:ACT domain-containing protein [Clostridia bacterium]
MKAVLTVIGNDSVGIIAGISSVLANDNVNIIDINQTIMSGMFTMVMIIEMNESESDFSTINDKLVKKGKELGVQVIVTREEIYKSMHRI